VWRGGVHSRCCAVACWCIHCGAVVLGWPDGRVAVCWCAVEPSGTLARGFIHPWGSEARRSAQFGFLNLIHGFGGKCNFVALLN
jgi:hypothetical protein